MNIAFFGTSNRSEPILDSLSGSYDLVLCITKTDTKVGRKLEAKETAVRSWAESHKVDYLTIGSIKGKEQKVIKKLKEHEIELGVVADFSFIIPKSIIDTPKYGLINIHFSLLPKLRGASPVQHAIIQGLDETGITYYLMDEDMDTGDILHQITYPLDHTETSGYLYEKLFKIAAENLPKVIKDYTSGKIEPKPQGDKQASYTYSKTRPKTTYVFKDDARIDWREQPLVIARKIRAFHPWPVAWTTLGELEENNKLNSQIKLKSSAYPNLRVKITSAETTNGAIKIKKLQVEGKNKIDWMSFVNGYAVRS